MAASTHRAALGAIPAAPLASAPAVTSALTAERSAASPELVRLIAKHERINARRDAACDENGMGRTWAATAAWSRPQG